MGSPHAQEELDLDLSPFGAESQVASDASDHGSGQGALSVLSACGTESASDARLIDDSDRSDAMSFAVSDGSGGLPPGLGVWRPGIDCGDWALGKSARLFAQGQVLVMNVYVNLRRVPASLFLELLTYLGRGSVSIIFPIGEPPPS